MFPKVWAAVGLEYSQLLDRLVELTLDRDQRRRSRQLRARGADELIARGPFAEERFATAMSASRQRSSR
jgi:hypothetical protein